MASHPQEEATVDSHPIQPAPDGAAALDEATVDPKAAPAPMSKKAAAKAEAKAARMAARGKAADQAAAKAEDDPLMDRYGDAPLTQSREQSGREWISIGACTPDRDGQEVRLRGRVHSVRGKGKSFFLILRQQLSTLQTLGFVNDKTVSKGMVKWACDLSRESVIDVTGVLWLPKEPIQSCTQQQTELHITDIHCVSRAGVLPFEVIDAGRTAEQLQGEEQFVDVSQDMRLNHRVLDLRTPFSQAVFRLQSATCTLFRDMLLQQGFTEIHSPKLIGGASEGGSAVFKLSYFGQDACLAQSPQFYKQMALAADMRRVFEIGPVFRAETSFTHRHMCEFTGLDFEMEINEHYFEVLDVVGRLFVGIFKGLQVAYEEELKAIAAVKPVPPFEWLPETLRLPFSEGIQMLQESGREVDPMGDLGTEDERVLGQLVKQRFHTDFYILYKYPLAVRPFYTMPDAEDSQWSCSFDVFMRGEEIISGAQRVHDPVMLAERASAHGVPLDTISGYLDSFKYGMPPHGGAGVGLERVVMLFCGLDNIRRTSLFPRDPKRLSP